MVGHRLGFLRLGDDICLGVLVRQLARMDDHKAHLLLYDAPILLLDLDGPEHALALPAPGSLLLRPPWLLQP